MADYLVGSAIFRKRRSEETTILQPGDVIAYKRGFVTIFRPNTDFASDFGCCFENPDDKLLFLLRGPDQLIEVAFILSVATGLAFRKVDGFPSFEIAIEFLKR